jgi:hypothetical protein
MAQLKKAASALLTLVMSTTLTAVGFAGTTFAFGQLTNASATLSNSTAAATSTVHTIDFKIASSANIGSIAIQYATTAFNSSKPNNLSTAGVGTTPAIQLDGAADAGWSTQDGTTTDGLVKIARGSATAYVSTHRLTVTLSNVTNNDLTSNCDGTADSTDSCWIEIRTYSDTAFTNLVDQTAVNYTVITPITVSATVDPILNFTIAGVNQGSFGDAANIGSGTTTTSTSTALSFGDLVVGTAKMAQQQLNVITNANGGYKVYNNFTGSQIMVGTAQPSNNIDPFVESSATWSSPQTWTAPTGSANSVNSGQLGIRTSNANVAGFSSGKYGPPTLSANTNAVMSSTTPDNGGTPTYVTFKLQVNAYQPADLYTGSTLYTVVPTY